MGLGLEVLEAISCHWAKIEWRRTVFSQSSSLSLATYVIEVLVWCVMWASVDPLRRCHVEQFLLHTCHEYSRTDDSI